MDGLERDHKMRKVLSERKASPELLLAARSRTLRDCLSDHSLTVVSVDT